MSWSLLIGALGGALSNFLLRLWQYGREHWQSRVEWFCKTVDETAAFGVKYWCEAGNKDKSTENRIHEASIVGRQQRMDGMLLTFINIFNEEDKNAINTAMQQFRDALTGGAFQTKSVKADYNRAIEIETAASELIISVRKAQDTANSPWSILTRMKRDLPFQKRTIESD